MRGSRVCASLYALGVGHARPETSENLKQEQAQTRAAGADTSSRSRRPRAQSSAGTEPGRGSRARWWAEESRVGHKPQFAELVNRRPCARADFDVLRSVVWTLGCTYIILCSSSAQWMSLRTPFSAVRVQLLSVPQPAVHLLRVPSTPLTTPSTPDPLTTPWTP